MAEAGMISLFTFSLGSCDCGRPKLGSVDSVLHLMAIASAAWVVAQNIVPKRSQAECVPDPIGPDALN